MKEQLKQKQRSLTLPALSETEWALGHVALTLARGQAAAAQRQAEARRFEEALSAVESCRELLEAKSGSAKLVQGGWVSVGTVLGHPYIGNKRAVYVWAKPEDGAGLLSIFDREGLSPNDSSGDRELLTADPQRAALWEVMVVESLSADDYSGENPSFSNQGRPCTVRFHAD